MRGTKRRMLLWFLTAALLVGNISGNGVCLPVFAGDSAAEAALYGAEPGEDQTAAGALTPEPAPELAPQTAPELAPQSAPELAPQTAPELAPQTAPELAPQTAPELAPQTAPELAPQSAPELTPEPASESSKQEEAPATGEELPEEPRLRVNTVRFRAEKGAEIWIDNQKLLDTDLQTEADGEAMEGTILFTVIAKEGFELDRVQIDGRQDARKSGNADNPDEYIIEGIETDQTVVDIAVKELSAKKGPALDGTDAADSAVEEIDEPQTAAKEAVFKAPGGQDAAAYFHSTITSVTDSCTSGATAMFTVDYRIDTGNINEGDYITVSVPADMYAAGTRLSVNSQHFSDVVDHGDGTYRLIFGEGGASAIAGSFSIMATTDETGTKTVTVGNDSKSITVNEKGESNSGGVVGGPLGYRVNKDAYLTDGVGWMGYNEEGQVAVYDSTDDRIITYRIYVNGGQETVSGAVVTDTLPEGMTYVNTDDIQLTYVAYNTTVGTVDPADYTLSISGRTMTISFHNTFSDAVEIKYSVLAKGNDAVRYKNDMTFIYNTESGSTVQDSTSATLVGSGSSAANGIKSVSRTELSEDDDQFIRYTITFWTAAGGGFEVGEITLDDVLNPYVHFLYADPSDYFDVSCTKNSGGSDVVHFSNTQAVAQYKTVTVSFVVDFSDVPVGAEIRNTVGGNVVETRKTGGLLKGSKRVSGINMAEGDFVFAAEQVKSLSDPSAVEGGISQIATNGRDGEISFDKLELETGGDYYFKIFEIAGSDPSIRYDGTYYLAKIAVEEYVQTAVNSEGETVTSKTLIPLGVTYYDAEGGELAGPSEVVFTNLAQTWISLQKIWDDNDDAAHARPASITVQLYAGEEPAGDPVVITAGSDAVVDGETVAKGWAYAWTGLPRYDGEGNEMEYTFKEDEIEGYTPSTERAGAAPDASAAYILKNTYQSTGGLSVTKTISGGMAANFDFKVELSDAAISGDYGDMTFSGGVAAFSLGNGETKTASGLPAGITYTVTETSQAPGYRVTSKTGDTGEIPAGDTAEAAFTNTYFVSGSVSVELMAKKTVDGAAADRPFNFELVDDGGNVIQTKQNSDETVAFDELTFSAEGTYVYTVRESAVQTTTDCLLDTAEYVVTIVVSDDGEGGLEKTVSIEKDGTAADEITFNNTTNITEVAGTKTWKAPEGTELPETITVHITGGAVDADYEVTPKEDGSWSVGDLPKYDENRELIEYEVAEVEPEGWKQIGTAPDFVNEITGTASISGKKIWNDADDRGGRRPASVTINLIANGVKVGKAVVKADKDGRWTFEFTNLPMYEDGKKIDYTVEEVPVEGYRTAITGDAGSGFEVTNSLEEEPETYQIQIRKVDISKNNQGLSGAKLELRDENGHVVVKWTSDGKAKLIEDLRAGVIYTVYETLVPEGYEEEPDPVTGTKGQVKFRFKQDGKVEVLSRTGIFDAVEKELLIRNAPKGRKWDKKPTPTPPNSGGGRTRSAKTGDKSPILAYLLLLLAAGAVIAGEARRRAKNFSGRNKR